MNKQLGKILQEARIKQSLSIEKISEETFIRKHILTALEQGNFSILTSAVQVRGFIRTYSDYLGLDSEELLKSLKQNQVKTLVLDEENNIENHDEIIPNINIKEMNIIFIEIGESIKNRRELLGLSLEEIETHTHIPINYLHLVESGSFNQFPSPTQARGMLGNYSNFLNMDKHSVMLRYAEALQSKLQTTQILENQKETHTTSKSTINLKLPLWLKNILSVDTLVFGILGIATLIFSIWGISHVLDIQSNTVIKPTAPALSSLLLPSPTASPEPSATLPSDEILIPSDPILQPVEITSTPTFQAFIGENIEIYIVVQERTFLRVIVDGKTEFDGRAIPGSNLPFTAFQNLEILTGNGSALQIIYNGEDIGPLGITGEVVNVIYTRNGLIYPTPTTVPTLDPELITPVPILVRTENPSN